MYSHRDLDSQMSSLAKEHYKSPSPPPSVSSSSTSSSSSPSSSSSSSEPDHSITDEPVPDENVGVAVPSVDEREYMAECCHDDGVLYSVGDVVHLMPVTARSVFCCIQSRLYSYVFLLILLTGSSQFFYYVCVTGCLACIVVLVMKRSKVNVGSHRW